METNLRIGLIGVGSMGHHFANRFLDHGYDMVIYDKIDKALDPYKGKERVIIASSPAEVADHAEILFVSLPSPQIIKDVAFGESGIIYGSRVRIYIDLSTTGQKTAAEIGEEMTQKGIAVLDAPVSGGTTGAKNGTLAVMVSGNEDIFLEMKPLLSIIGKNIFYIGENVGQAQVMKLANNLLSATAMAVTSEAVLLGIKAGIDPEIMISVINAGSGRNSASMDKFSNYILNGKYDYGFKTSLMYKDLVLCMQTAEDLNQSMWLGSNIKQCWGYAVNHGDKNEDFTRIFEHLQKFTNTPISTKTTL